MIEDGDKEDNCQKVAEIEDIEKQLCVNVCDINEEGADFIGEHDLWVIN